jgi:CBS domain containing-hemolysin-like protein
VSSLWLDAVLVLVVLALTACAAVFVSAEYALTTLERMQIEAHVAAVGDRRAAWLARAHRALSFQLSGTQLGITLTTLVTGYLAEPAIAGLLLPLALTVGLPTGVAQGLCYALALLLAAGLSVIFGELVPKNLAIARPLAIARAVIGFQSWFSVAFRWPINWLNSSANWVLRRLGIEPAEELRSARAPDELGSLVRSAEARGTLDAGTATLLNRSLAFGERSAEELMTPRVRVRSLPRTATVAELTAASRRSGLSRFPVHDGDLDDVLGAVHVKQAFGVAAADRATTVLGDLATPIPKVPSTLGSDTLLDRLRRASLQMAVVVDEWGGSAGIVTLEDVVEEIVGDVRDEYDRPESAVRALAKGAWIVSGLLRADEVAEATGFAMPEGEYETLAGLMLAELGRIPSAGDGVTVGDTRLTVVRMDRHRIADVRIAKQSSRHEVATEALRVGGHSMRADRGTRG